MLLTTEEAAERLRLTKATLEGWRCRGGGPAFLRLGGRAIRYREEDLHRFIEEAVHRNTAEIKS